MPGEMASRSMRGKRPKGISSPLIMVMVTVSMIALTSFMSSTGLSVINSIQADGGLAMPYNLQALHSAIEELSASAPGASRSISLKLFQGEISVTSNGLTAIPGSPICLADPNMIVASFGPSGIVYDATKVTLSPSLTISGIVQVSLTVEPSLAARKIRIEASKP